MIILNYSVKFRSFGITFGTVSGSADVTGPLKALLFKWAGGIVPPIVPAFKETVMFDDRGVFISLVGK